MMIKPIGKTWPDDLKTGLWIFPQKCAGYFTEK
jgi:hypothetical protein